MCFECVTMNRRRLLSAAGLALAGGMLGLGGFARPAAAKTALHPDEALARLKAGNAKFVDSPELCEVDLKTVRQAAAKGQSPWATIVSCADSRVPPELVFGGLTLGELFVCRNAGNLADTDTLGSIEYAVEHLGSPLIVVLGHQRCGAVSAACEAVEKATKSPGSIGPMVDQILPAAKAMKGKKGDFIDNAVRENARRTAAHIVKDSEIVREAVEAGHVKVVHARYELDTGTVEFLA